MKFSEQKKLKAVTLSYDDGVTQDLRLLDLLEKYGLKCTFNLNSDLLGGRGMLDRNGQKIIHYKIDPRDVKHVYDGHEVAVHTLTHPSLPDLDDAEVVRQVEEDRIKLSELVGYEVVGMAYPFGTTDERIASLIKNETGVKYCRTVINTDSFEPQADLYMLDPNVFHLQYDRMMKMAQDFIDMKPDRPQIFYIWGHAYELDYAPDYGRGVEEFFKLISGKDDIFYGTNAEVLL